MSDIGVGDKLYNGAAEFGQVVTSFKLVIAVIISLFLFGFGIYLIFSKNKYTEKVNATVVTVTCDLLANQKMYDCNLTITYTYDSKSYTETYQINSEYEYKVNDKITIYVDPTNPSDFSNSLDRKKNAGYLCIGFAIFILSISILVWWLSRRYKFFAAVEGAGTGIGMITGGYGRSYGRIF